LLAEAALETGYKLGELTDHPMLPEPIEDSDDESYEDDPQGMEAGNDGADIEEARRNAFIQ
jgi:hypothetical protein